MKTITEILNEMILKNEKEIKRVEKNLNETNIELMDNQIINMKKFKKIKEITEKIEKTILILSISIILNTISIIILNLWR